jgi:hypothetical protein
MTVGELIREAGHTLGPDHPQLLLARIWTDKNADTYQLRKLHRDNQLLLNDSGAPAFTVSSSEWQAVEERLMTFCVNSADHVAKANRAIVKAADDTDVEPAEEEAGEQLQEVPRIDLYTPPKPQCQQQVTTLVAANGPPSQRPHGQQRRLIGSRKCLEVLNQK